VKCCVWRIALYCAENWTLQKIDQKYLGSFKIWCWRMIRRNKVLQSQGEEKYHTFNKKRED
jgi:hypothetical protein